jgi:hypothetical protein
VRERLKELKKKNKIKSNICPRASELKGNRNDTLYEELGIKN